MTTVRSFKKCNKDARPRQGTWHVMEMFSSFDKIWDYCKKLFLEVVGEHAPLHGVKVRMKIEWIDDDIHKLMRARNYYRMKHRKTKLLEDWKVFEDLRNEGRKKLRLAKERHYTSLCQNKVFQSIQRK